MGMAGNVMCIDGCRRRVIRRDVMDRTDEMRWDRKGRAFAERSVCLYQLHGQKDLMAWGIASLQRDSTLLRRFSGAHTPSLPRSQQPSS